MSPQESFGGTCRHDVCLKKGKSKGRYKQLMLILSLSEDGGGDVDAIEVMGAVSDDLSDDNGEASRR